MNPEELAAIIQFHGHFCPGLAIGVRESIQCEACGEMVMETRLRLLGGRKLCIPCFKAGERQL